MRPIAKVVPITVAMNALLRLSLKLRDRFARLASRDAFFLIIGLYGGAMLARLLAEITSALLQCNDGFDPSPKHQYADGKSQEGEDKF